MSETVSDQILTTDGIPLKVSLKKAERRNKWRAFFLVAPLLIFHFERISLLSPIPNLLILPFIIAPMSLGFLVGVLGWIWLPLAKLIAYPLFYFLEYFLKVIEGFAKVPGMSMRVSIGFWGMVGVYALLILFTIILSNKFKNKH